MKSLHLLHVTLVKSSGEKMQSLYSKTAFISVFTACEICWLDSSESEILC